MYSSHVISTANRCNSGKAVPAQGKAGYIPINSNRAILMNTSSVFIPKPSDRVISLIRRAQLSFRWMPEGGIKVFGSNALIQRVADLDYSKY